MQLAIMSSFLWQPLLDIFKFHFFKLINPGCILFIPLLHLLLCVIQWEMTRLRKRTQPSISLIGIGRFMLWSGFDTLMACHQILGDHHCWEHVLFNVWSHWSSQLVSLPGLKKQSYELQTAVVANSVNNSVPWWELSWLSYHINIRNAFLKWTFATAELLTTSLLFSDGFKSHDAATLALVFFFIYWFDIINICASAWCLPVCLLLYFVGNFL